MNVFVGAAAASVASMPLEALGSPLPASVPKLAFDGSQCGDAMREAYYKLDEANEALKLTAADFQRVWKACGEWQKANPQPGAHRAHKKYCRRYDKHMDEINYDAVFDAHQKARDAFKAAQLALANVKVRDLAELCLKACMIYVFEDVRQPHLRHVDPVISVSVAMDLAAMAAPTKGEA